MRTYTSRKRRTAKAHEVHSPERAAPPTKRQPTSQDSHSNRPTKRAKYKPLQDGQLKQKTLRQLHFCIDQSVIRKCPLCGLCYTKGAKEDMELHRVHCARVQKGLEWGRDEEKEGYAASITEIKQRVKFKNGKVGRIIAFPADVTGKMGSKLAMLLEMINTYLSSPALGESALQASRAYLFLVPEGGSARTERITGCIIAQRITTAMAILPPTASTPESSANSIDIGGAFCNPEPLPTPMGISRLFVSSAYRRQGIAMQLLSAAASSFIPGCILDPKKGQVAFSQPTSEGAQIMQNWGGGAVRILHT